MGGLFDMAKDPFVGPGEKLEKIGLPKPDLKRGPPMPKDFMKAKEKSPAAQLLGSK
jgi:hypothetical protein